MTQTSKTGHNFQRFRC